MAPRSAPTDAELVSEIEAVMTDEQRHQGAVPLKHLIATLRHRLRTVPRSAEIWVQNLATAEGSPVRIFSVTKDGQMDAFLKRSNEYDNAIESKWHYHNAFDWSATSPGGKSLSNVRAPHFDDMGTPTENPAHCWPSYLIFTDTLAALMAEAEKRTAEHRSQVVRDRIAELAATEEVYGDALDVVRGAMREVRAAAPQSRWQAEMRATQYVPRGDNPSMTMVELRVTNAQIEALAAILRSAGVEPVKRDLNNPTEEIP